MRRNGLTAAALLCAGIAALSGPAVAHAKVLEYTTDLVLRLKAGEGTYSDQNRTVPAVAGDIVRSWADLSGAGHHALLLSGDPRLAGNVQGGRAGVRFSGDDAMGMLGQVLTSQQYSIFAVVSDTSAPASGNRTIFSNWRTTNQTTSVFLGTTTFSTKRTFRLTDQFLGGSSPFTPLVDPATPFVLTGVNGGSDAWVWQDDSLLKSRGYALPARNFATSYYLGRQGNNTAFEGWEGDILELLVYNRAVTPAERQEIWDYLGEEYSMNVPEPASLLLLSLGALALRRRR